MNNQELEHELQGMNLVRKAWGYYTDNIIKIICIVMIIALPVEGIKNYLFIDMDADVMASRTFWINIISSIILTVLPAVSICLMVPQMINERAISIKESFKIGAKFWPKLIVFSIVVDFLVFLGLIFLIVPGLVYATRFLFVNYIIILEGTYGNNPIARSNEMIKGRTWGFFLIMLSISLIQWGITYFLGYTVDSWVMGVITDLINDMIIVFTTILFLVAYLAIRRSEDPEQVIDFDL